MDTRRSGRRVPPLLGRLGLALASVVVGLIAGEIVLRILRPHGTLRSAQELPWMNTLPHVRTAFTVDPDFGFRPVLGTKLYDENGILHATYDDTSGVDRDRVLFIGDSVTANGKILEATRAACERSGVEFLNAGVGSFNTLQEIAYYRAYNHRVDPDHVVLTFNMNDVETTPVAFREADGRLRVYATFAPYEDVDLTLYEHSYLYRLFLGLRYPRDSRMDDLLDEIEGALADFAAELDEHDIAFTVLVMPLSLPRDHWTTRDTQVYERVVSILGTHGIDHVDLRPALDRASADGLPLAPSEGDVHHVTEELAALYADACAERIALCAR